ncbi:MAG: CapA family protein [Clostridium sp.]|uniref:CapA family protein n=1 Tax=Clostridium sp. TaxID=1506 RepID=UPI003F3C1449
MKKNKNLIPFCIGTLLILIMVAFGYFALNNKIISKTPPLIEAIPKEDIKIKEPSDMEFNITSLGNLIVHQSQINGAKTSSGNYNFDRSFEYISPLLKNDSLSLGIVEGSFAGGTPSGYPLFNIPDSFLSSLKASGLDIINFSTNHSIDKGISGFKRSLNKISENDFKTIGVRKDTSSPKYLIYDLNGHKVGFFAYTFRTAANNGNSINSIPLSPELAPLINSFDYNNLSSFDKEVKDIISDMQKEGVQFIISSIHWGNEYNTTQNNYQKEMAKILNNNNVDVILGGHPHVIQPYETLKNKLGKETLVFYSQGNTLSNQCYEEIGNYNAEDGIIVSLTLGIKNEKLYLKNYDIIPTWVYRKKNENGTLTHQIIPVIDALNSPDNFNLSSDVITRLNNSLNRTKNIVGSNNLSSLEETKN